MEEQIPHGLPEFREVLGSWRPDFLVGEGTKGGLYPSAETFCLTEINARFCFNGFMHEAYGQQALLHLGVEDRGLYGATDPAKVRPTSELPSLNNLTNTIGSRSLGVYTVYFVSIAPCTC